MKNLQVKVPVELERRIEQKAADLNLRRPDFMRLVLSAATSDRFDFRFFDKEATNEQSPAA